MRRIAGMRNGVLAMVLVVAGGVGMRAQTPILEEPGYKPTLTFDVATIRQSPPPDAHFHVSVSSPVDSSRFEATNLPIKTLLQIAYGFDAPVIGLPEWAGNSFYDIRARSEHDPESWPSIFTAVQEQMGLKLEAVHEAVPNLVVDRMTKPTEN